MHDLVRLFAAEMAATDPDDAERALKSVVEHYRAGVIMAFEWLTAVASEVTRRVFPTPAHAAAWFEAERATVISIVMQITGRDGYEEICLQFGVVLADLLKSQAHWRSDFYDVAAGLDPACWTRLIPDFSRGKRDDPTRWQESITPRSSAGMQSSCIA